MHPYERLAQPIIESTRTVSIDFAVPEQNNRDIWCYLDNITFNIYDIKNK